MVEDSRGRNTSAAKRALLAITGLAIIGGGAVPLLGASASSGVQSRAAFVTAQNLPSATPRSGPATGVHEAPKATKTVVSAESVEAPKVLPSGQTTLGTKVAIVSRPDVLRLVRANFPSDQVTNAMAVANCESGQQSVQGETNSDGTTDWGIFQLNDGGTLQSALSAIGVSAVNKTAAATSAMEASTNVRAAAQIWRARGWSPWVCAYKQQIVAKLYTNDPGPLDGRYSLAGVIDSAAVEQLKRAEAKRKSAALNDRVAALKQKTAAAAAKNRRAALAAQKEASAVAAHKEASAVAAQKKAAAAAEQKKAERNAVKADKNKPKLDSPTTSPNKTTSPTPSASSSATRSARGSAPGDLSASPPPAST